MQVTRQGNKVILDFDVGEYNAKLIDLLLSIETANKSKASEKDINTLALETKKGWWQKNKNRFINENDR